MPWRSGSDSGPAGGWRAGSDTFQPWASDFYVSVIVNEPGDTWSVPVAVIVSAEVAINEPGDIWQVGASAPRHVEVDVSEEGDQWSVLVRQLLHAAIVVSEPGDMWEVHASSAMAARVLVREPGDRWIVGARVIPFPPTPFDPWRQDLQLLTCGRVVPTLHDAPVIRQIQTVLAQPSDDLYQSFWASLNIRLLSKARGTWLETLGRIIGLYPRPSIDAADIVYFTPDLAPGAPDIAPVFVEGAPTSGVQPAGDGEYLTAIYARIFRNHVRYGSVPEIKRWIFLAYGVDSSIRRLGSSSVRIIVPDSTSDAVVEALASYVTDEVGDIVYNVPLPAGTLLESVVTVSEDV